MDKPGFEERLFAGAERLGLSLREGASEQLYWLLEELLRWNARVNLTAITDRGEVLEKHFLDSLAVLPEMDGATSVLDLGSGAGFPGLVLKIARPDLQVTMVDAVAKKIGFTKHAIAQLKLGPDCRAIHARAEGAPDRDRLPRADRVVSRALMDLPDWVPLASNYLQPGGAVVAMLGKAPAEGAADRTAEKVGLKVDSSRAYALPFSGAERHILVFR